jgi:hypothetical protein
MEPRACLGGERRQVQAVVNGCQGGVDRPARNKGLYFFGYAMRRVKLRDAKVFWFFFSKKNILALLP